MKFTTKMERSPDSDEINVTFTFTASQMEAAEYGSKLGHIMLSGCEAHPAVVMGAIWDMYKRAGKN